MSRVDAIIAAGLSGAAALIVCIINNLFQQRKADREQDKRITESDHKQEIALAEVKAATDKAIMEMSAQVQQSIAIVDCKFDELTKKVEKHNQIVERTYKAEKDIEVIYEKIKVANHRIDGIASGTKSLPS